MEGFVEVGNRLKMQQVKGYIRFRHNIGLHLWQQENTSNTV